MKIKKLIRRKYKNNYNSFFLFVNISFYYLMFVNFSSLIAKQVNFLRFPILFFEYKYYLDNLKKHFNLFLKNSRNNSFITLTDSVGNVIFSLSGGKIGLKSKKSKNSPVTTYLMVDELIKRLNYKRINKITSLYLTSPNRNWLYNLLFKLKYNRISIQNIRYISPRIHNNGLTRKKKLRRI